MVRLKQDGVPIIGFTWYSLTDQVEIAPELTGHGLPLAKCEAYNRVYDQHARSG
jgi:hypothetical protein